MSMTQRERFRALFSGEQVDRLPVYFFGTWRETKERWLEEGNLPPFNMFADEGPQLPDMDDDWEQGMWDCNGFVNHNPIFEGERKVLQETDDTVIIEYPSGSIVQHGKRGSTIQHTLRFALEPTRESWERFKRSLDAGDIRRYAPDWQQRARAFAQRQRVATFIGGSLYGWLRDWMGVEQLSLLMYDDPELLREMVGYIADFCIRLLGPVAKLADFDFVYLFEDCCGANGPLFSPAVYRSIFAPSYERLIRFYKQECGIPFVLLDSDGCTDALIPCWLDSGVDILFPVEVGVWGGSPVKLREKYGSAVAMLGGVDKHLINHPERMRQHLEGLLPAVRQGRYLPIPDHRIPPDVSLDAFRAYLKLFAEVFAM